jgi:hypothetical protein
MNSSLEIFPSQTFLTNAGMNPFAEDFSSEWALVRVEQEDERDFGAKILDAGEGILRSRRGSPEKDGLEVSPGQEVCQVFKRPGGSGA